MDPGVGRVRVHRGFGDAARGSGVVDFSGQGRNTARAELAADCLSAGVVDGDRCFRVVCNASIVSD